MKKKSCPKLDKRLTLPYIILLVKLQMWKEVIFVFTAISLLVFFVIRKYFSSHEHYEYTEIVHTFQGDVRGVVRNSTKGQHFLYFTGIPYAQPPLGKLRFQPPMDPQCWSGVKDVIEPPPMCIQMDTAITMSIDGQEDCLYLNVFTRKLPKKSTEKKTLLPVFVFIHGGAFTAGNSNPEGLYGPEMLMNKEIVFVTLNYRIGALGLLSTGTKLLPGNLSLKDQVMALHWVQQNIANFGGDPNLVTLFGVSSGAACVHYHMMSPLSKGLFHRSITMSGTAMNSWAYMTKKTAETLIKYVAENVNCPTEIGEEMVDCLKESDAEDLVRALGLYKEYDLIPDVIVRPIAEEEGSPMRFLHDTPYELTRQGKIIDVPWLTGFTQNEGLLFALTSLGFNLKSRIIVSDCENAFPHIFDYRHTTKNHTYVTQEMIKYHYHGKIPTEGNIEDISELTTYRQFITGFHKSLQPLVDINSKRTYPIYLYKVSSGPKIESSFLRVFSLNMVTPQSGVTHWEDFFLLFKPHMPMLFEDLSTPEELAVSENVINAFVQFGITGNPNTDSEEICWKPLTSAFEYTDINVKFSIKDDFPFEVVNFYSSLNIADGGRTLD